MFQARVCFEFYPCGACQLEWLTEIISEPTTEQVEDLMGPERQEGELDSDVEDADNEDDEMDID